MGVTLPLLAWSISLDKMVRSLRLLPGWAPCGTGMWQDSQGTGCLPAALSSRRATRTTGRTQLRPGGHPGPPGKGQRRPPDPRTGMEVMQGPREGVALALDRTAGAGESLQADAKSWSTTLPQNLRLPAGQWGAPRRPSPDPAEGAGRKGSGPGPGCPRASICPSAKWGSSPERPGRLTRGQVPLVDTCLGFESP